MSISLKNPQEQAKMRVAGRLAGAVLDMIGEHVRPGVTTDQLNTLCHRYITEVQDAIPAPLNYRGFPKSVCISVNHVVCHGIPGPKKLKKGDIANIDVTVIKDGWHGDTSRMYLIGEPSVQARRICDIAHEAMRRGIALVRPGARLGDIGHVIQSYVESENCSVVRDYCGHGIGKVFHEDPKVLHYGEPATGLTLKTGMTFTIEPMVNVGGYETKLNEKDGWTVWTKDHSLSAQWEHTILVTESGHEVLTLGASGEI